MRTGIYDGRVLRREFPIIGMTPVPARAWREQSPEVRAAERNGHPVLLAYCLGFAIATRLT